MYEAAPTAILNRTGIAVLGCGDWGMNYVRVLSELPDSRVSVVCDQRPSRLDEVRKRFFDIALTTDVDEALGMPGVDAVVISTQAVTHHDLAKRALLAGKHVLVEKPLTTTVVRADELIALAQSQDRILLVGHTFVYNIGVRKVKEYVEDGTVGDVYYVYSRRTNLGPIRRDVNALWDLAPHDVAIFNYLLDSAPQWVSAVGARVLGNSREDVGFISLGYPEDIIGHIHVSWADPHKVREVVVVGSDKRVAFNDLDPLERVRIFDKGVKPVPQEEPTTFGEYHFQLRNGDITSPSLPASEPLKRVCGHFLHCIRRGEAPHTDARQGRDVVSVMEAAERSMHENGAPVPVADVGNESLRDHLGDDLVRALR